MMVANWTDPQSFLLNLTNAALGLATLALVLIIFGAVAVDLYSRARGRATVYTPDFHALHAPELGLTMADGGEKIDEREGSNHKETSPPRERE